MTPSGLDVSRETADRLATLVELVRRWNRTINLVSAGSLEDIWHRHILDSAQLWRLRPANIILWRDLGSGGGFPGLVLAILARENGASTRFELIESDQRKAAFLTTAARSLEVPVTVHAARIEDLELAPAPVISARALAPLAQLVGYAKSLRAVDGTALFPKGQTVHKEIAEAARRWSFAHRLHPSATDPRSAVVEIGAIDGPRET